MLNMNRVTLLGHAGRDPELRDLKKGGRAAVFTLATTERWKDRDGKPVQTTEWHRIAVYGPAAETVGRMLRKGDAVLVEGRLASREYRDREGVDRRIAEIVVAGPQGIVNVLSARRTASEDGDAGAPQSGEAA